MKSSGNQKKRRDGNEFVSMENDIYQSANGSSKQENEEAVMQENDIYQGGAAAAAAAGDVYSQDVKPLKTVKKDNEDARKDKKTTKEKDKDLGKQKDAEKNKNKKKKDDKIPLKPKKTHQRRGDVYENTVPGQFGDGTYANAGYVADDGDAAPTEGLKSGRDEDGLLYVSLDFGNARPSTEVHRAEESTEYAGIAFGQVGPPPPPDEEAEDEKKK
ncbi:uncharacterized protein DDB_G0286299-like [Haliotis cracherodii]|uniref:uncharacterized protein DDB_G0286299-like n=1 Tax=Haliotis cracherodii TaxID=6455 RepID=UPI0039EC63BA